MRSIEKFSQKDALTAVTNIRTAEESAKTARETAATVPDKNVKQQLQTLASKFDADAKALSERLFTRLEKRLVGDNRAKLLKLVEENINIFPE